ncbi:winged helix-turn-helix domain-containing protein [Qipengyuania sediminis]|uniref:winged helix-turn-helix domain-containing protein n=1 Tax=Qipengyuania sediminis TaxID=1532023 RepID=UPI001404A679|nr:winged helix-turn-helix domain-containing protein [Qipengyuania sediminis]
MHGTDRAGLNAADLSRLPAIALGTARIDAASHSIRGPGGTVVLRPQVMLVFLALHEAGGRVVGRDDLIARAWSGRFVAEDSLNGAISELRRALRAAGVDDVEVVTVPKTGYRLKQPGQAAIILDGESPTPSTPVLGGNRRALLFGGAAALAAAGAGAWLWRDRERDREVARLINRGLIALRQGLPQVDAQGIDAFRAATRADPDNARAWGLLALSLRAATEYAPPANLATLREQAEAAARTALTIDPAQLDARTALVLLEPAFGRWFEVEAELRAILKQDPDNAFASSALATLLMSTGQVRSCLRLLDWQVQHFPLSPNLQFRRVYTLWSAGRLRDAEGVAARAMQSWPRHPAVWFAQFWLFAFTERAFRAQAMLADIGTRPSMPPAAAALLDLSLAALARPSPELTARAVAAHLRAAAAGPAQAISAILVLSGLDAGAESLAVARGFLAQRGEVLVTPRHSARQVSVTDQHHRMTMMLWIPATRALRDQGGFDGLCRDIGLADYWRRSGKRPDPEVWTPPPA